MDKPVTLCLHHPPRVCHSCGERREYRVRRWHESRRWRAYDLACAHCGAEYRVIYRRPRWRTSVEVLA